MESSDSVAQALVIEEYKQLKQEQIQRIHSRDNFVNLTVVAVGTVSAVAVTRGGLRSEVLAVIPWITTTLGWTFIVNDLKIARLSKYLEILVANHVDGTSWDAWRRGDGRSWIEHRIVGTLIQNVIFVVPTAIATALFPVVRVGGHAMSFWESVVVGSGWAAAVLLSLAIYAASRQRRVNPHRDSD